MKKTKFQIVSDLHIDHDKNYMYCVKNLFPKGEVLIVAGDCCSFAYKKRTKFINSVFSRFNTVIEIPGNHDSYELPKEWDFAVHAKEYTKFDNGNEHWYINNDYIDIGDVRIIGTTLWSEIKTDHLIITRGLNDYHLIKGFTISDSNDRLKKAVEFLDKAIESTPENMKIIVVTHHLPLLDLISEKFSRSPLNPAYASNLYSFVSKNSHRVNYWVHGHSHDLLRVKMSNTEFIRNPLGYLIYDEGKNFNTGLVLEP